MAQTLTLSQVQAFDTDTRDALLSFARNALALHETSILQEVAAFDAYRASNEREWLQRVTIKSILSSGALLDSDIAFARILVRALRNGERLVTYNDAEPYRASCKYGARSVGKNILHALHSWATLATLTGDDMTIERLQALRDARLLAGLSQKTIRWALVMYDARTRAITCDTHIIALSAKIAGLGDGYNGIAKSAYPSLEQFWLSIADELGYGHMPLVVQWACWNEQRHAGTHASHLAIVD